MPGIDLDAYKHQLIERFSNPEVRDTVARLCAESSDRIPKWLVPVIRHNLAAGGGDRAVGRRRGRWARYAEGVDEQGEPIEVVDRLAKAAASAPAQREDPLAFVPTGSCSATWSTTRVRQDVPAAPGVAARAVARAPRSRSWSARSAVSSCRGPARQRVRCRLARRACHWRARRWSLARRDRGEQRRPVGQLHLEPGNLGQPE